MPRAINWTPELEQSILDWISEGKTLREFCRQEGMPSHDAVYDHEKLSKEFEQRIARARESGEEVIAQECLEIADDGSNDWMERIGKDGQSLGWMVNGEAVMRSKLRVETRLKLLAKWNPRKYGDRIQQEVTGKDGGPIQAAVTVEFVKPNGTSSTE